TEQVLYTFDAREGGEVPVRREAAVAHGVVLLAALRVGQDLVGRVDLLELRLLGLVAAGLVRVVLLGQPAIGLLDLVGARGLRDAGEFVEVLFPAPRHVRAPPGCAAYGARLWASPVAIPPEPGGGARRRSARRTSGRLVVCGGPDLVEGDLTAKDV